MLDRMLAVTDGLIAEIVEHLGSGEWGESGMLDVEDARCDEEEVEVDTYPEVNGVISALAL